MGRTLWWSVALACLGASPAYGAEGKVWVALTDDCEVERNQFREFLLIETAGRGRLDDDGPFDYQIQCPSGDAEIRDPHNAIVRSVSLASHSGVTRARLLALAFGELLFRPTEPRELGADEQALLENEPEPEANSDAQLEAAVENDGEQASDPSVWGLALRGVGVLTQDTERVGGGFEVELQRGLPHSTRAYLALGGARLLESTASGEIRTWRGDLAGGFEWSPLESEDWAIYLGPLLRGAYALLEGVPESSTQSSNSVSGVTWGLALRGALDWKLRPGRLSAVFEWGHTVNTGVALVEGQAVDVLDGQWLRLGFGFSWGADE